MEKFKENYNTSNVTEQIIVANQKTGEARVALATKGKTMVEDIHRAIEKAQEWAGIKEEK